MVGQTLGHYALLEEIGAGGMGRVYRARDLRLERDVAIKILPPNTLADTESRKLFRREALALSKLNHPNIATIHDFDTDGQVDFLVMEHIAGITLGDKLKLGPLKEKEILRLGLQMAEGLVAAHNAGILHRDLKPGNLRVISDGRLKILDFGLAKLLPAASDTATTESKSRSARAGTLAYMAPEQMLCEKLDARTDIYAAGNVLYEMAAGRLPFEKPSGSSSEEGSRPQAMAALYTRISIEESVLHETPVAVRALNTRISPELENITLKCLEKEPENRYQSAAELVIDLRRLTNSSAASMLTSPLLRRSNAGRLAAFLALAFALVLAIPITMKLSQRSAPRVRSQIRSLAVLPLENLSGDSRQDYFADGMTDELISRMARSVGLRVISRTSTMQYKGTHKSLPEIAKELGVDGVVEGSVARAGDRVRISAQLIDASADQHLWTGSYNRSIHDILALQDEVAEEIANQIQVHLTPVESTKRTVDPQVYEAYLEGRYLWNKRTPEDTRAALARFQKALAIDPKYAPAYAGVADCYMTLGPSLNAIPTMDALAQARTAVIKALQLDPNLAEAHATLAEIGLIGEWNWTLAETEIKKALELNPGYATAHHWYGFYFGYQGKPEEARKEMERARELDPLSPIIQTNVGWTYYIARDYNKSIQVLQTVLEQNPDFWVARFGLGSSYVQKREYAQGIEELQKAVQLSHYDSSTLSSLAYAEAVAGRRSTAEKILQELLQRTGQREAAPADLAIIYIGLGDRNKALDLLERACQEHAESLLLLKADPWFDSLRAEPRFQKLLRKIGLAET